MILQKRKLVGLYYFQSYHFMKIKCSHCNGMVEITLDKLIFENEDEEVFVSYLAAEMSHPPKGDFISEETRK